MSEKKRTRVLLIGWDAADRKIIDSLLKKGKMPNLEKLISGGAFGSIQTLDPPLSPMLWTSIATGKTADKHGILGFIEPDPVTSEPRPAAVTSRNCKAIWNILCQEGYCTNVIGWWPSHPAEPVNGIYVSNMFTKTERETALMCGSVHPENCSSEIEKGRVYADDISIADLLPFVPKAKEIDQSKDKHLHNLAALLANCNSIQNAAKCAMQKNDWDLTAVYFDTIDQTSHTFMKFYPPQLDGVPNEYFDLYQEVVSQMYVHHDKMLVELLELAGTDVNVILLSDHGFYSDHLRPVRLPNDPASPALEHSRFGVLCLNGPSFNKGIEINRASLLDITPTLLQLFGLPLAEDMDGISLQEIFVKKFPEQKIKSWEERDGNSGMHEKNKLDNSWHSTAAMFQMMELGYIEKLNSDKEKVLKKIVAESNFYLSRVLISKQEYERALPLLEELNKDFPSVLRYAMRFLACLQYLDKIKECEDLLKEIKQRFPREKEILDLADAIMESLVGDHQSALEHFKKIEENVKHLPALYVMMGNEYAKLRNAELAENCFVKAMALDPDVDLRSMNTFDGINDLDLNPDRSIDFRKYQLIIRLFLEQFHKGAKKIN